MTPETIDSLLESAVQHHEAGRSAQAEEIYRQILGQKPDDPDALYLLGVLIGQRGEIDSAIEMIERAISIDDSMAEYHCSVGEFYSRRKEADKAIAAFEKAISLEPEFPMAWFDLGAARSEKGDLDGAIAAYQKAATLMPDPSSAYTNLGIALKTQGRVEEAIDAYQAAIAKDPRGFRAYNNLGNALSSQRKFEQSIEAFRKAVELKPDFLEAYRNLGGVYTSLHRHTEAIGVFSRAVQLNAADFDSWFCLGNALRDGGQWDDSIKAFNEAIRLKPEYAGTYANISNVYRHRGMLDKAVAASLKALELDPKLLVAMNNLANCYKELGKLDEAIQVLRKALAIDPDFMVSRSNLCYSVQFHPDYDRAMIRDENLEWARIFAAPLAKEIRPHGNDRDPNRKLRIGYVSADFRWHPVGRSLLPVMMKHDANRVEVYCYSSTTRPDFLTPRFKEFAAAWRDVADLTDELLAVRIRDDQIDILVDISLHMTGNRLLVFARAPVQVTWLGYPGTTGMQSIDYRLTDPIMDPPGEGDEFYTEKSIRLPKTFQCYDPLMEALEINALPAEANGFITFGCLNNFTKINEPLLESWARILVQTERSRLILKSSGDGAARWAAEVFERNGIAQDRIEFISYLPSHEAYIRQYKRIDLALDPFPYSGHTTSLDALWMGVPSVTLSGRTAVSRGGASILTNMGLPEFIAHTPEEYVSIAVKTAGDRAKLAALRAGLRQRLQASPIMNAGQFTADLETVYRGIWTEWCGK